MFWNFKPSPEPQEDIELRIDGDIMMDEDMWGQLFAYDPVTPKGFMAELANYAGKNLTVWINSGGGETYAASRIYTALKEHKGKVTVKIDGMAMSAASVIAMAGAEVQMAPTSIMMIHNPVYGTWGEATDLRHAADILDEVKETIINAYQLKTGRSRNYISRLMDEETYMSAKKALAEGFADSMLYRPTEQQTEDQAPAVAFGRLKIINTAAEASRNFMQEYTRRYNQAHPPDAGTRKIPVDTYDYLKSRNERRLRT